MTPPTHPLPPLQGYLTSCTSGSIRVCQLPLRSRLDSPWQAAKVPLRATPLRLAHYREGSLLVVAVQRGGVKYRWAAVGVSVSVGRQEQVGAVGA